MEKLGKGGYGTVFLEDEKAVKYFKRFNSTVQEICLTLMMSDSDYIVPILDYNLGNMTMTTKLYDCSLREAFLNYRFSFRDKEEIFVSVLKGLSDLHNREIIHADVRLSNILINIDDLETVICDLGLSNVNGYAKVQYTAETYRCPIDTGNNQYINDMYGLCVTFYQLFSEIKLRRQHSYFELREMINENIENEKIRTILNSCIGNLNEIPFPLEILNTYYSRYRPLKRKDVGREHFSHIPIDNLSKYIYKNIENNYKLPRSKLGYIVTCYLETRIDPMIYDRKFSIYIVLFVLCCIYGKFEITKEKLIKEFNDRDIEDIYFYMKIVLESKLMIFLLLQRR